MSSPYPFHSSVVCHDICPVITHMTGRRQASPLPSKIWNIVRREGKCFIQILLRGHQMTAGGL